jgi:hypothetical protein
MEYFYVSYNHFHVWKIGSQELPTATMQTPFLPGQENLQCLKNIDLYREGLKSIIRERESVCVCVCVYWGSAEEEA